MKDLIGTGSTAGIQAPVGSSPIFVSRAKPLDKESCLSRDLNKYGIWPLYNPLE